MIKSSSLAIGLLFVSLAAIGCGGGSDGGGSTDAAATPPPADRPAAPSAATPAEGAASLSGTILFDGAMPKLPALRMDADPGCAKKHTAPVMSEALVLGENKELANIFVWVKGGLPEATWPAPSEPVVLDQRGCRYVPHVMGLIVGQPLKVLNSDALLHNIHSLPKINSSFNRAMPGNVTEAEYAFTKQEVMFKVKCDVHPWMNAWLGVVSHPYFAVTGTDGKFEIAGLPAGTYEVEAWHERLDAQTVTVTLADGEAATTDFTFTR